MPGGDRTGPYGAGPLTGWGRGFCGRGRGASADEGWSAGHSYGGSFGRGRGWRHRFWATGNSGWQRGGWWHGAGPVRGWFTQAPENELRMLEHEARALESELERVRARLDELSKSMTDSE